MTPPPLPEVEPVLRERLSDLAERALLAAWLDGLAVGLMLGLVICLATHVWSNRK